MLKFRHISVTGKEWKNLFQTGNLPWKGDITVHITKNSPQIVINFNVAEADKQPSKSTKAIKLWKVLGNLNNFRSFTSTQEKDNLHLLLCFVCSFFASSSSITLCAL